MTNERIQLSNNGQSFVRRFQKRQQIISKFHQRFSIYGYEQIDVPTYESYDLYTSIQGTVHRHDMVKIIDPSGEVLVLRPDVTIPIMKKVADEYTERPIDVQRYFYTLSVYRHSFGEGNQQERTQTGVELLGDNSLEADAEMIALAIHNLRDLSLKNFKIECGHAKFVQSLMDDLSLTTTEQDQLNQLIHTKNMIELRPFLNELNIDEATKESIEQIPLMYGRPAEVFKRAESLVLNKAMEQNLNYLKQVYALLHDYGVSDHIIIDLGLINQMAYYSGVIFQGFVETVGKPILMGGRYNDLSKQFQGDIPAIGFAIDIDTLLSSFSKGSNYKTEGPIIVTYKRPERKRALSFIQQLRSRNYRVIALNDEQRNYDTDNSTVINFQKNTLQIKKQTFTTTEELYNWLQKRRTTIDVDDTRFSER